MKSNSAITMMSTFDNRLLKTEADGNVILSIECILHWKVCCCWRRRTLNRRKFFLLLLCRLLKWIEGRRKNRGCLYFFGLKATNLVWQSFVISTCLSFLKRKLVWHKIIIVRTIAVIIIYPIIFLHFILESRFWKVYVPSKAVQVMMTYFIPLIVTDAFMTFKMHLHELSYLICFRETSMQKHHSNDV